MRRPDGGAAAAAIAVHDVSPATWDGCRQLLAMLDDAGAAPLSLLVIPRYHHAERPFDRAFTRGMEERLAQGDELILHGYFHLDDAPAPRTPAAWFERRVLTRSEGEFAALDERESASRLARGIELFRTLGWPLHGFVPPAWLMSDGARAALSHCGHPFEYVTVRQGIHHLPRWDFERTANLCYSPSSIPRRLMSQALIHRELARARGTSLLRVSLHPQDARVPQVMAHWRRLIDDVVRSRALVTKREWARRVREQSAPARRAPEKGSAVAVA